MQLTSPIIGSIQQRLDLDATTTNAQRDALRIVDPKLRNFDQTTEAALSLLQAGQDVYDNYHSLSGYEPTTGGRVVDGATGLAGLALGAGELAAANEHFKKGDKVLGSIGIASGLTTAACGGLGLAQAAGVHAFLGSASLDKVSGIATGVSGILDGVEDFHEVAHGGEKLAFGAIGALKVAAGAMEAVGAATAHPVIEAVGSTLYLGSLMAQYAHAPDHWETDLAQHLALFENG